jgi:DNA-binding transcriptional LysR family regulator
MFITKNGIMDKFSQLRVFVAVAEEQGFSAAARRLKTSPPSVTRAVAALEEGLGVALLKRTTRSVRVTEAGHRYLEDARQILSALQAADDAAGGINAEPRGHLAVTAPVMFGRKFVMSAVTDYLVRYPETEIETLFLDRVVNLVDEGLDVGVRIGELPDSTLRAIRVGEVRSVLVAAPAYIEKYGSPLNPQQLRDHTTIATSAGNFSVSWRFANSGDHPLRVQPRLRTTTNDSAIEAAVKAFGIARLISYQVADEIKSGHLVRLLPEYEPPPLPVNIIHREGRYASARIRAFIELLVESLRIRIDEF